MESMFWIIDWVAMLKPGHSVLEMIVRATTP
jgi:hypothetical protein